MIDHRISRRNSVIHHKWQHTERQGNALLFAYQDGSIDFFFLLLFYYIIFYFILLTRKKLITNTCYFNYENIYIYMAKNKLNL